MPDTVLGKGHQVGFVTLTERVFKLNRVIPIVYKGEEAIIQALKFFAAWFHTITLITKASWQEQPRCQCAG